MNAQATYSFVIPLHNEEESLTELLRRVTEVMDRLDGPAEVVLVDDGSTDSTWEVLRAARENDDRFRLVGLSRNFGHQVAITAGLDAASGEAVVVMDGDLQDPPEVALEMVEKWREGFDIVYGIRKERQGESAAKRLTARWFYRVLNRVSPVKSPPDVGDFRLVSRRALDSFRLLRERNRYARGMFSWIGFDQCGVDYVRDPRYRGTTKYSRRRMFRLAADAIVSFSSAPLRLALTIGFLFSGVAFMGGLVAVLAKFTGMYVVPGWASLLAAIFFLGGIQLVVLGLVGEYIARIYDEVKARPLYIVREASGVEPETIGREPSPG